MRCVTRDETWGIPVPIEGSDGKVLYVWFDAPIGYISAAKEWSEKIGEKEKWKEFWLDQKTKLVNFIGKDNIPFHTLFFPAMVMGQNKEFKLVDEVPANEFLLLEGKQFSKSDGWYIDLEEFFSNFTSDQVRYYLAAIAPETSDSEFIWKDFQTRCNSELLGKFGNFIHRTLVFAKNNCSSKSPSIENPDDLDNQFLKDIDSYIDQISEAYENFHLIKASQLIMELAHKGNVYFDKKKPWKLAKDESFQEQMNTIIACCLSCIKALALISSPIIPKTSQNVWELIGYKTELSSKLWKEIKDKKIPAGQLLPPPKVLFRKIEDEEIEKEIKKLGKMSEKKEEESCSSKEEISYKDFQRLDMRVGKIIQADKIEKSKKLIKLIVDIGSEKRQIVSGIFPSYSPEDLIGKQVIVLINLKPVKLMNIESQGMILAAGDDSNLELPFVHGQKPGSIVC
jgi:methionyl-tRNA synthetase